MSTPFSVFCHGIAVLLLVLMSMGSRAQGTDIRMLRDINLHRNKSLDPLMKGLTNSTYPVIVAVPAAEIITGYARHDKEMIRNGWFTIVGLGFTGIVTYGLKYGIDRKPPYVTYPDLDPYEHGISPSFPSGHASFAYFSATTLSMYYPKWYVIAPSFLWASAVGYSRMHLGDHYPSDVLVGAALGAGSAWLSYKATKWLHKKVIIKRKPPAHHLGPDTPRGAS